MQPSSSRLNFLSVAIRRSKSARPRPCLYGATQRAAVKQILREALRKKPRLTERGLVAEDPRSLPRSRRPINVSHRPRWKGLPAHQLEGSWPGEAGKHR